MLASRPGLVAVLLLLVASGLTAAECGERPEERIRAALRERDFAEAVAGYRHAFDPGTPEGRAALRELSLELLRTDLGGEDPYERNVVAGVLGRRGDARALETLERSLDSLDPLESRTAADALARVGTPEALARLHALYARDRDARRIVLSALATTRDPSALPLYLDALTSPDLGARILGLKQIGELRLTQARAAVDALRRRERHPLAQTYADFSLARLGDPESLERLKDRLHHERPDVRDSAAGLLGGFDDPSVPELLREALADRAPSVRASAGASLTRFHDASGLDAVEASLRHPDLRVRVGALSSLTRMHYGTARPLVRRALRFEDPSVRALALQVVAEHRDASLAAEILRAAREDSETLVRAQAILALGQLGDSRGLDLILATLAEPDEILRHAAAESALELTEAQAESDGVRDERREKAESSPSAQSPPSTWRTSKSRSHSR